MVQINGRTVLKAVMPCHDVTDIFDSRIETSSFTDMGGHRVPRRELNDVQNTYHNVS